MHPGNNKQSVDLALAIFHPTTVVAVKSYFPAREDMAGFIQLISTWWTIVNSSDRYTSNWLSNAIETGDGKTEFMRKFADWIEQWSESPAFRLSKQTSAALIDELLISGEYDFIIPRRFQSDPLEKRFSQYRQMSGGRFLVSLVEVRNSELILSCRSLLKEDVNFWMEKDLTFNLSQSGLEEFSSYLQDNDSYFYEATLTDEGEEVATTVAGYIGKKLSERSTCSECKAALVLPKGSAFENNYFNLLSRGGLTVPSPSLAEFVVNGFAILDIADAIIARFPSIPTRNAAEFILKKYSHTVRFTCEQHRDWGMKFPLNQL